MADPTKVASGPGTLYFAPVGTDLPDDQNFDFGTSNDWTEIGYTEGGHTFGMAPDFEDLTPAETFDPVAVLQTGRNITVSFTMWESTFSNLQKALNGGTITDTAGDTTFVPPEVGDVSYVMIGWSSKDQANPDRKQARVWRKCLSTGNVEIVQNKGQVAGIAAEFRVLVPDDDDTAHGHAPFVFYDGPVPVTP